VYAALMGLIRCTAAAFLLAVPSLCATSILFRLTLPSRMTASVVGPDGSVYLAGYVVEDVIPVTQGVMQGLFRATNCPESGIAYPCPHGFVARISPDGSQVLWATYLGGGGADEVWALAVDRGGNVFVSGSTTSQDFPITAGVYRSRPGEGFVAKLSPDGRALGASTYLGGVATAVAVDAGGSVFLTGFVRGADFQTTAGVYQSARYAEDRDAFVLKLDSGLRTAAYSTLLGGSGGDAAHAIVVDSQGNAVVTGLTIAPVVGVRFPATPGSYQHVSATSVFASKLNASGSALLFSSVFGGEGGSYGMRVALDSSSNVYIHGVAPPGFPVTPLAFSSGQGNGFVVKLTAGGSLEWSTYVPAQPALLDGSTHFAVSPAGRVFLTGEIGGTLPTTHDSLQPCRSGIDAQRKLVLELNDTGTERLYGAWLRFAAALDSSGGLWIPSESKILERFDLTTPRSPQVTCVSNSASFVMDRVAPGEVVALFGSSIGPDAPAYARLDSLGRIASEIGGVTASVNGIPAPLLYASRVQINAVAPYGVAGAQNASFVVQKDGVNLPGITLPVRETSPAVFVPGVLNQDNTVNGQFNPAPLGSVIQIWGTGGGAMQPAPADGELGKGATRIAQTVHARGTVVWGFMRFVTFPLDVEYAGDAPTLVQGVFQINARLPQVIEYGVGTGTAASLVVTIGGVESPATTFWIKAVAP